MRKIEVLWDVQAFGGHDVSALAALKHLASVPEFQVSAVHTGRNSRLRSELAGLVSPTGRLEAVEVAAPTCISESLDALWRGPRTRALVRGLQERRPEMAVNIQGFITQGLCFLAACRTLRIPVVSFLPMTHRVWTIQPSPIALAQDLLNRHWYSLPAAFLVTSARMKEKLVREQGVPAGKIAVVEYGPDLTALRTGDRAAARKKLNLPDQRVVGVIGRTEFRQKRQDFLIRAVARHREALEGFLFLMVGEGPDLPAAKALAAKLGVSGRIQFLPWQEDMTEVYSAVDAVLIPSRFEGVPLVMLEAMARRIPVLASDVDGMADFLPPECLFRAGDARQMVTQLLALRKSASSDLLDPLADLIESRLNAKIFAERFTGEIVRLAQGAWR